MPKSNAERQKAYLQRKKNENKEAYLDKEREEKRLARQKRKNENGNAYKQYLEKEKARKKDSYKQGFFQAFFHTTIFVFQFAFVKGQRPFLTPKT